jgi:hypothetical protein
MPKEPGGGPIIAGDDKKDSIRFHQQLGEDRVHSLADLKRILGPLESSRMFERQNLPDEDLETYLTHEENIHWGNPLYKFQTGRAPTVEGYLSLEYSPWLNEDENVLIQGRASFEEYAQDIWLESLENKVRADGAIEFLYDDEDPLWISIPTDPGDHQKYYLEIQRRMITVAERLEEIR